MNIYNTILLIFLFSAGIVPSYSQTKEKAEIDSMHSELPKTEEDTNLVKILLNLSKDYISINSDSGLKYGVQARNLSQKINWKKGESLGYFYSGWNLDNKGEYVLAMDYFLRALKISQELGNKSITADNLKWIGLTFWTEGNYSNALAYYLKAEKLFEEIGNKNGVASMLDNIGVIYFLQDEHPKAFYYHFKSLKLSEEIGDQHYIADNLRNIGIIYESESDYVKALDYYFQSMKVSEALGENYEIGSAYGSIGNLYELLNDYPKALEYCFKSLKIFEGYGYNFGISEDLIRIGGIYLKQNRLNEAGKYLFDALKISMDLHSLERIRDVNKKLSEFYEKKEDWKGSIEHYKKYITARDSMFDMDKNRKIVQLEMKYKFEKMQDSVVAEQRLQASIISNLKKDRNIIIGSLLVLFLLSGILIYYRNQRKKLIINKQVIDVEMKALRAQINPHFMFNALNSIYSFIRMNDMNSASEYVLNFSKLMRMTLENSMQPYISLEEELEALELYMSLESIRLNHKFSYHVNVMKDVEQSNMLIPPMLLQPYVENSIWHGMENKEHGGQIDIQIEKENQMLKFTISDNGKGLSASKEPKVHRSYGSSLSAQRIEMLNRLKGAKGYVKITEGSEDINPGVRVELAIPVLN